MTKLVRHILFHNFWSFLLVLSGLADIGIGAVVYFTGSVRNAPVPVALICFIVGFIYLSAGLLLAVIKFRKRTN